ncbi:hypothetical protein V2O64_08625 [Verrucomicrobiaceae bacterium 227]
MKKKINWGATLLAGVLSLPSQSAEIPVSQDGWVDFLDGDVKDGGIGERLNVATANPSGAFQYTRMAFFGFDVSAVDLTDVQTVNFSATLSEDVIAGYAGATLRFYLVGNSIGDSFDETTLADSGAPGLTIGDPIALNRISGAVIGEVVLSDVPAAERVSVRFSASAVADLVNDENDFLTVVVENRTPNNGGYNDATGLGFQSKESGAGATLSTSSRYLTSTPVVQDGWVDLGDVDVKDTGTGDRLSIATPDPSGAVEFSRVGYFGFDLGDVDFTGVGSAVFKAQLSPDVIGYQGALVRFTLVSNSLADDSFDETTLLDTNAPGFTPGDLLATQTTEGIVLGDVYISPSSNPLVAVDFPKDAFSDLGNDSNDFVTVVAEVRSPSNVGYDDFTGVGFASRESGDGASLVFGPAIIEGSTYSDFVAGYGLAGENAAPDFDFDGDGQSNLIEFALGGSDPTATGIFTPLTSAIQTIRGQTAHLLITLLPADTTGNPSDVAGGSVELLSPSLGVSFTIEGGTDLESFAEDISEVIGVDYSALPAAPAGFTYRAFQTDVLPGVDPQGYLRIVLNVL